jgi:hypothetical protein
MSAPTIVQQNWVTNGTSHGTNLTPSLTGVTLGNYHLSLILFNPSSGNAGVVYAVPTDSAGQTCPPAIASQASGNNPVAVGAQAFGLTSANAGTHTLTYNSGTPQAYAFSGLIELAGVNAVDQQIVGLNNRATNTFALSTGTLAQAAELVIAAMTLVDEVGLQTNEGITDPPAGFTSTLYVNQNAVTSAAGEVCSVTTAATTALTATWNFTNTGSAAGLILSFAGVGPLTISPSTGAAAMQGNAPALGTGIIPRTARQRWEQTKGGILAPVRKIFLPPRFVSAPAY